MCHDIELNVDSIARSILQKNISVHILILKSGVLLMSDQADKLRRIVERLTNTEEPKKKQNEKRPRE